jgi:hypothetical protein
MTYIGLNHDVIVWREIAVLTIQNPSGERLCEEKTIIYFLPQHALSIKYLLTNVC